MSSTAITAQGIAIARFGTTAFETIPNVVSFQGPGRAGRRDRRHQPGLHRQGKARGPA